MRDAFRLNSRQLIVAGRLTFAAAAAGLWLSTTALAQNTLTVGGGGHPSVEIDLGVVEEQAGQAGQGPITVAPGLAPVGSLPQLQLQYPGERSVGRITLTRPGNQTAPTLRRPPRRTAPAMAAVPREPVTSAPIPAAKPPVAPAIRAPAPTITDQRPGIAAPPAPRPPAAPNATTELRSTTPQIDTSRPAPPSPAPRVASKAPIAPLPAAPLPAAPSPAATFPPPPAPLSRPATAKTRPLPAAPQPKPPPQPAIATTAPKAPPPVAALPRPPVANATPSSPKVIAAPPPPPAAIPAPSVAATPPKPAPADAAATPPAPPPLPEAPAPTAAPAREPAPAPDKTTRMVALPPAGGEILQAEFAAGSSALSRDVETRLSVLAAQLKSTEARLQLKAFASASDDNISRARRLSLSRALAVRSHLIEQGLRSTRIDVRALGIARDGGAADRVDIVLLSP